MIRVLALTILLLGPAAGAQVALPQGPLRGLPGGLPAGLPGVGLPLGAQQTLGALIEDVHRLQDARGLSVRLLLRRHSDVVEADPNGNPIVRDELVAFAPSDAALARAASAGFSILREQTFVSLGVRVAVLEVPHAMATSRALSLLRRLDPAGAYDFNSIYMQGGATQGSATRDPAGMHSGAGGEAGTAAVEVGLIDGGVGTAQAVFQGTVIHRHGCDGAVIPSTHGIEVASLMVGRSARFGGAAPGATLYAADVYCGKPTGGAVGAIADALAWLLAQHVPVINVSLVGPPNVLLQQLVARVVAQGVLIVAAVGNDGPAAPALYPAAYPGVVGVTAVDRHRRVIFEAERGPQVMFAAPGADIPAATESNGFAAVRGTSFAAPLVAGLLAARLKAAAGARDPGPPSDTAAAARAAVAALARAAVHLGSSGRNTVFGYGLVGAGLPAPRPATPE